MFGLNDNSQDQNMNQAENGPAPAFSPAPKDQSAPLAVQAKPTAPSDSGNRTPSNDFLISLKEQALTNLSPLLDHLDQSPEERFRTLMMLIQASDNANLIKDAHDTANKIKDDKVRAQALLDVVNEINYFTQKDGQVKN